MAVSIELLDDYHKSNAFTIIAGENILLKFVPNVENRIKIREIINITDLPQSAELSIAKEISKLSKRLTEVLGSYVEDFSKNPPKKSELAKYKKTIEEISAEIIKHERLMNINICDRHYFCFCTKCDAYMGEADNLTTKCSVCGEALKDSGQLSVSYLSSIKGRYLEGFWFEDYIERLLSKDGWKVWTHGSVMGSSGIMHPIDFLAVKDHKVLIGECKAGGVDTRDISHFLVQKLDIPSHFGLFLSVNPCAAKSTASFFEVSTSLLIDDIGKKTEQELMGIINSHVDKFKK
jgi:hypothetical protein